jgi:AraC-like DNA-binding protein
MVMRISLRKRLAAARIEILRSKRSLAQVAAEFGFSSSQYLATCFQRVLGRTPSSYRISPDSKARG